MLVLMSVHRVEDSGGSGTAGPNNNWLSVVQASILSKPKHVGVDKSGGLWRIEVTCWHVDRGRRVFIHHFDKKRFKFIWNINLLGACVRELCIERVSTTCSWKPLSERKRIRKTG